MFLVRKKNQEDCKFDALELLRCEDIEGMVAPEKDLKSFRTFEKQVPRLCLDTDL